MSESRELFTYSELGVDIDVGNRIVDRIALFADAGDSPFRGGGGTWRVSADCSI